MRRQKESRERPIIARRFYAQDEPGGERKLILCVCGRAAVVWDKKLGRFYCSRCWEFVEV